MNSVNPQLNNYAENFLLVQYEKNDAGHSREHAEYVIRRSLLFAQQFEGIDRDMIFAAAVYHDIAHHINKKIHEKLSAEIFYSDEKMKDFFTESQRLTIKEAIEDHRASLGSVPRSDYGKILSSADRSTDVDDFLRRTHAYTLRHFPGCDEKEMIKRAFDHTLEKYGKTGYASHYVEDAEYTAFRENILHILSDYEVFAEKYKDINGI